MGLGNLSKGRKGNSGDGNGLHGEMSFGNQLVRMYRRCPGRIVHASIRSRSAGLYIQRLQICQPRSIKLLILKVKQPKRIYSLDWAILAYRNKETSHC
jgi:hypothetical protein